MEVIDIENEASLEALICENEIVIIDFWAPWCRPCLGFHPILQKVARDHQDLVFCRVDTSRLSSLRAAFDVELIPTLVVVRDRVLVASEKGMLPESALESIVQQARDLDMDEVRSAAEAEGAVESGSSRPDGAD